MKAEVLVDFAASDERTVHHRRNLIEALRCEAAVEAARRIGVGQELDLKNIKLCGTISAFVFAVAAVVLALFVDSGVWSLAAAGAAAFCFGLTAGANHAEKWFDASVEVEIEQQKYEIRKLTRNLQDMEPEKRWRVDDGYM